MTKKLFLTAGLGLLGLLQTAHSSWAAEAEKQPSQAQNLKEQSYNLSVYNHGGYVLSVWYINCDGNEAHETIWAGNTLKRCAKKGTDVSTSVSPDPKKYPIPLHNNDTTSNSLTMPAGTIQMDCGGSVFTKRCDWRTLYKVQ